jgi:hypothetical protein
MILTRLLSILALAFAVAADFDKYQDTYTDIAVTMTALDDAIFNITDTSSIAVLAPLAKAVTDAVQKGISTISAQPPLTSDEMSMFIVTSQMQLDGVALVVTDLETLKGEIAAAKGKPAILKMVKKLRDLNKQLDGVILTKVPADSKTLIQTQSTDMLASLDKCASLFEG